MQNGKKRTLSGLLAGATDSKKCKAKSYTRSQLEVRATGPTLADNEALADHENIYTPLDTGQIRLFKIEPSEASDDELELTLLVCNLLDVQDEYIAVSYTWLDEVFSLKSQVSRTASTCVHNLQWNAACSRHETLASAFATTRGRCARKERRISHQHGSQGA